MHSKPVLGREEVARVLGAAREEAQRQGWAVSIAVVDDGGHPLVLVDGQVVGAVGVSGVRAEEDARVARIGAEGL
ncbi:heme-binding protein [Pseudomonas aeruginosa]|nr:heme-binding protein [Pseudomonas aeruginosa]